MNRTAGFQHTIPELFSTPAARKPVDISRLRDWDAPTFGEFVRQLEHEFGDALDLSSLPLTSADDGEALSPGSVRELCELLGVPPEDFGV